MPDKFYITTTTPYVNGEPHIGFAREIVVADVIARWRALMGDEVKFNTGADEHGQKVYEKAKELGKDPQTYTDELAPRFERLKSLLDLSFTNFTRTTDPHHKAAAQEFWRRCDKSGYIYKGKHKIKYCIGCELEKTDSELEDDKCPIHPNKELEIREEENYFFKFSAFAEPLLSLYAHNPNLVLPDFRFNEIKKFVGSGLQDFSISRLKEKMSWGVPVPGDDAHVMYVWFDALVNYISAIGWPDDMARFNEWWPVIQYCGKDNNRQQSAMWQAMLMSAKLPNSKHIIVDGFINPGGQKMSKSLGNVINPYDVVETFKSVTDFPEDVLRFVLLHDMPSFEDGDLTLESIKASYAAHLQNGLGNLTSRIMKMAQEHLPEPVLCMGGSVSHYGFCESFELQKEITHLWEYIGHVDALIQIEKPFQVVKVDKEKAVALITVLVKK